MLATILATILAVTALTAVTFAAYLVLHVVRYRRHRARMSAHRHTIVRAAYRRDRDAWHARRMSAYGAALVRR